MANTVKVALDKATACLRPISRSPAQDARMLLCHVLSCGSADLRMRGADALTASQQNQFSDCVAQRKAHKPVSQIIGHRWFYKHQFAVTSDVLDPRPETELLIEKSLLSAPTGPHRILDLGTGSGCLLLSYLLEVPQATGVGVDISEAALKVAQGNAGRHNLMSRCSFIHGSWVRGIEECFDIILCNPPYIARAEMADLAPDVIQWEPYQALTSGETGLEAYKHLSKVLKAVLKPSTGRIFLEVGASQADQVKEFFALQNFQGDIYLDLEGKKRCICLYYRLN